MRIFPDPGFPYAALSNSRVEFVSTTDLDGKSGGMHHDGYHVQSQVLRNAHQACI